MDEVRSRDAVGICVENRKKRAGLKILVSVVRFRDPALLKSRG